VNRLSRRGESEEEVGRKRIEEERGESLNPTLFPLEALHSQLDPSPPFQLWSDPSSLGQTLPAVISPFQSEPVNSMLFIRKLL